MNENSELWTKVLAFDAKHGPNGPDELARMIVEHHEAGRADVVTELRLMGQMLEDYHRAGARKPH